MAWLVPSELNLAGKALLLVFACALLSAAALVLGGQFGLIEVDPGATAAWGALSVGLLTGAIVLLAVDRRQESAGRD